MNLEDCFFLFCHLLRLVSNRLFVYAFICDFKPNPFSFEAIWIINVPMDVEDERNALNAYGAKKIDCVCHFWGICQPSNQTPSIKWPIHVFMPFAMLYELCPAAFFRLHQNDKCERRSKQIKTIPFTWNIKKVVEYMSICPFFDVITTVYLYRFGNDCDGMEQAQERNKFVRGILVR